MGVLPYTRLACGWGRGVPAPLPVCVLVARWILLVARNGNFEPQRSAPQGFPRMPLAYTRGGRNGRPRKVRSLPLALIDPRDLCTTPTTNQDHARPPPQEKNGGSFFLDFFQNTTLHVAKNRRKEIYLEFTHIFLLVMASILSCLPNLLSYFARKARCGFPISLHGSPPRLAFRPTRKTTKRH